MDENTPSWIRDLYQDIYPQITNPSQGRRVPWGGATGPMVSAFRQRSATAPKIPMLPPPQANINPTNPWAPTVTREPPPNAQPPNINGMPLLPFGTSRGQNFNPSSQGFDESGFISNLPNLQPPEPNPEATPSGRLNLGQFSNLRTPSTLPNIPNPLDAAGLGVGNVPSPFDLLGRAVRSMTRTPTAQAIVQHGRQAGGADRPRRPYVWNFGSGHVGPDTDILDPLNIQDLLTALRGGRNSE